MDMEILNTFFKNSFGFSSKHYFMIVFPNFGETARRSVIQITEKHSGKSIGLCQCVLQVIE